MAALCLQPDHLITPPVGMTGRSVRGLDKPILSERCPKFVTAVTSHGMECADEVAVFKRALSPLVGGGPAGGEERDAGMSNGFSSRRLRSVLAVSTSAFTQTAADTIERALAAKSEVRKQKTEVRTQNTAQRAALKDLAQPAPSSAAARDLRSDLILGRHRFSDSPSTLDFDTAVRDPHWIRHDALGSRWSLDVTIAHTEAGTVPRAGHDVVF